MADVEMADADAPVAKSKTTNKSAKSGEGAAEGKKRFEVKKV